MHRACLLALALGCSAALAQPARVQEGERIQTGTERVRVLANRHTLQVNRQSELRVDQLRPNALRASVQRGSVVAHVPTLAPRESVELGTPNLSLRPASPARFRIDVDPQREVTQVTVLSGSVTVYGHKGESRVLTPAEGGTFAGRALLRAAPVRPHPQPGLPDIDIDADRASRSVG